MQDFIVHIIVGVCVVWAGVLIYKSLKNRHSNKCAGCPLGSSCCEASEASDCTRYAGTQKTGTTFRTRNIRDK